ncbi:class I mannose-6-phosphate isomerase [bacterium]|nr:class I mannose-6-phosphate isomerase [bacterium]
MSNSNIFKIKPHVMHYNWGKVASGLAFELSPTQDRSRPTAELWYGAHPKGPATIVNQDSEAALTCELPYLFKILSVAQALSVQTHPTKKLARILHYSNPVEYPDDREKVELAVALTPVRLLAGFISRAELDRRLQETPELDKLLSARSNGANVADLFSELLKTGSEQINRYAQFFLKEWDLTPGEAIVIEPGLVHAYLSGDLVELITNSDNVIRLGLTEKFIDVPAYEKLRSELQSEVRPAILKGQAISSNDDSISALKYDSIRAGLSLRIYKGTGLLTLNASSRDLLVILEGSANLENLELKPGDGCLMNPVLGNPQSSVAKIHLHNATVFHSTADR